MTSINHQYSDQTIFLTSFAKDMWEASGQKLINTFKKYQPKHQLVICYENFDFKSDDPRILGHNLNQDPFLSEWLRKNADIIPNVLGGEATPENHPEIFESHWNRLASRWFRKIVSMKHLLEEYGPRYQQIIWVDADAYFTQTLTDQKIKEVFGSNDVFYHLGPRRKLAGMGVESGLIGFKKKKGYQLLQKVILKYKDGSFRKYPKWDDGYLFRRTIEEQNLLNLKLVPEKRIKSQDLVHDLVKGQVRTRVIEYGPFKNFIVHEKGKHKGKRF